MPPTLLLALGVARAHVPHDPVLAMAAPADGDPTAPWFLLADPQGVHLWLRSDDAGGTWTMVGGALTADSLLDAGRLPDGAVAVLGEVSLWWTTDAGATWTAEALPGAVTKLEVLGDELLVAGDDGAFLGRPDTGWTQVSADAVQRLGPRAFFVRGERVHVDDGAWGTAPAPPEQPTSVAYDGVTAWVGSADGAVWGWAGGDWFACGALPDAGLEHGDVVELGILGGRLAALTGLGGPYTSTDNCASWADTRQPEAIEYDEGGAGSADDAQDFMLSLGDVWAVGGWAGLALSTDEGLSWSMPTLVPADYARGIAFSTDWGERPDLYIASYASAILMSPDGGRSWEAPNHGLDVTNAQRVQTRPEDPAALYALVNHRPFVSSDRGANWSMLVRNHTTVEEILFWSDPAHIWLSGEVVDESFDGGVTWTRRADLEAVLGTRLVAGLVLLDDRACVTTGQPSGYACSFDEGATWTTHEHGSDGRVSAPVGWPPEAPTRLIWGDASGLARVELADGAETWLPTEPVDEVAVTADGRLFAATRSAQLLVSDDGGETWSELGERLPAHIHALAPRPDWAEHPQLLAATHDGVYIVAEDGSARRVEYERVDNLSSYASCDGCPDVTEDLTANMDSIQQLPEGAVLRVEARGTALRILGRSQNGGGADLTIDGVGHGVFGNGDADGVLVEVAGLEPGWHEVVLSAMPGAQLEFDVLEASGDGGLLEFDTAEPVTAVTGEVAAVAGPPEPRPRPRPLTECGCGGSISAGFWLGSATILRRRRRFGPV